MLEKLKTANKVVGIKQLKRALKDRTAQTVFLAEDADPRLMEPLRAACEQAQVELVLVPTMQELGKACSIAVGAAAAAILR
jgi:large subunit ribosomal protein L7A